MMALAPPPDWLEAASLWALRGSAIAVALALVLAAARRLGGRRWHPRWTYMLAWLAVIRLLWPVAPPSRWSVWNLADRPEPKPAALSEPAAPTGLTGLTGLTDLTDLTDLTEPAEPEPAAELNGLDAGQVWAWVWLAGGIVLLARLAGRQWVFGRRMRRAVRWDLPWPDLLDECRAAARVRRPVRLAVADGLASPVVCGLWRPRIIFPRDVADGLGRDDVRHVLLHELAHIRAGDLAAGGVVAVARALHWFNPAAHWLARQLMSSRESLRDGAALRCLPPTAENRAAYGRTLLRLAAPGTPDQPAAVLTAPLFTRTKEIQHRIAMIAQPSRLQRLRPWQAAVAAAALLGAGAAAFTSAQNPEPAPQPESAAPPAATPAPVDPLGELEHLVKALNENQQPDLAKRLESALDLLRRQPGDPAGAAAAAAAAESAKVVVKASDLDSLHQEMEILRRQVGELKEVLTSRAQPAAQATEVAGPGRHGDDQRDVKSHALVQHLVATEQKIAQLAAIGLGERHPDMVALRAGLEAVKAQTEKHLGSVAADVAVKKAATKRKEETADSLTHLMQHLAQLRSDLIDAQLEVSQADGTTNHEEFLKLKHREADIQKKIIHEEASLETLRLRLRMLGGMGDQ